ncbi:hypothetical protein ACUYGN_17510 [Enterobacter chengduensis]
MESLKLLMRADTIDRLPCGNEWQSAYLVAGRRFAHERINVKGAFAMGIERYGDAMLKLAKKEEGNG